jgi:hypothetical protein
MSDELAAIRDSVEMRNHLRPSEGLALLREVDRLSAELAGRRAGEKELAEARTDAEFARQRPSLRSLPIVVAMDHIDFLDGRIIDLLNMDGRALREAGAAEERKRIVAEIRLEAERRGGVNAGGACLLDSIANQLEGESTPLPDLLPPQEARAALDAERRKVATLREACERIAVTGRPIEDTEATADESLLAARRIARKTLEATQ